MPNTDLEKYVLSAREKNISDEVIQEELVKHGWSKAEVDEVFSPKPKTNLDLPPPPVPHFSLWVTFQYVILFITLYVSATSVGGILHHLVDQSVKDSLNFDSYRSSWNNSWQDTLLKGYTAGLIVTFPMFAYLYLVLKKQALAKPAVKNIRSRKILIYFTMVATFVIMIGHLISTIFGFLGGTTTLNSFGHLAVTFLVAGSIFVYLLNEVREDRKSE